MDYPVPQHYQGRFQFDLHASELVWRDNYYFLLQRGYQLRPRYKPGWQGSWLTNGKSISECEDSHLKNHKPVLDAVRVSDGVKVALKLVHTDREEIPIGVYFSSKALQSDPRNHCISILDIIPMAHNDIFAFIVMPLLLPFSHPPFVRKIECLEAFHQMLEGLEFIHEHNVAHRDACFLNFLMDATKLIPKGFHYCQRFYHPDGVTEIVHKSRKAVGPMKYYWIDFGLSYRFRSFEERHWLVGKLGQEKDIPELSWTVPYNPFKVDIFQVGMAIKRTCEEYDGLEFMQPFIAHLTQEDPRSRPSASEALRELERLRKTLSRGKLNGLVIDRISGSGTTSQQQSRMRRKRISAWKKRKMENAFSWLSSQTET